MDMTVGDNYTDEQIQSAIDTTLQDVDVEKDDEDFEEYFWQDFIYFTRLQT